MVRKAILLNGPSSSGKSTLAKALQAHIQEECGIVSIDEFLQMSTDNAIYEEDVFAISSRIGEKAAQILELGQGVIIDHVITSERIFKRLLETLEAYDVILIRVTCPLEILKQREIERNNRCAGSAEASLAYLFPKDGYDLTVDTMELSIRECCRRIAELLR